MEREWGPWKCPRKDGPACIGEYVHLIHNEWATAMLGESESFGYVIRNEWDAVEKYRTRKPLGLTQLETIVNELPNPAQLETI